MDKRALPEVDQYIEKLPEHIQEITKTLREMILDTSSEIEEQYKWARPVYDYKGGFCYLQANKQHVNFGFQKGNELAEQSLLSGSGKAMRHLKVSSLDDIDEAVFAGLIREAMTLNKEKEN